MKIKLLISFCLLALATAQDTCTLSNCNDCSNPSIRCKECDAGEVLSNTQTKCLSCPANCKTCTADASDVVTCTACNDATYQAADGTCTACPTGCIDCSLNTENAVVCNECQAEGYVADPSSTDTPCKECPSNCKTCSLDADGVTTCSACFSYTSEDKQGYFLKTSDKSCKSCGSKASKCSDNGSGSASITNCYSGYVVKSDNTKCLQCPTECSSCEGTELSGKATCTACTANLGNFLVDGACTECTTDCTSCEDDSKCSDCDQGFRVDSGSCTACPAKCNECSVDDESGDDVCSECTDNFGTKLASSVTCDRCTLANCKVCTMSSTTGDHSCTTCLDGYAKNGDGVCTSCGTGCTTCEWDATTDAANPFMKCTACASDYGGPFPLVADQTKANPGVCKACSSEKTNCITCSAADPPVCSECGEGFYWDSNDGECKAQSVANCVTITDNTNDCTACEAGYKLDTAACATACTATDCKECANDAAICSSCAIGWKAYDTTGNGGDANACLDCGISKCTDCSITGDATNGYVKKCTTCETGYTVYDKDTKSTSEGVSCRSCTSGCDECTYDYDNSVGKCNANKCSARYAYKSDGTCEACSENCATCAINNDVNECSACDTGYAVQDGACGQCPENCDECEYNTDASQMECKANKCKSGYGLISQGQCGACPGDCTTCSVLDSEAAPDTLTCDTCTEGYAKNSRVCGACPSNCKECKDESGTMECTECKSGYALDTVTKECVSCFANCESCTSSNSVVKCSDCRDGYSRSVDQLSCILCATAAFESCATCEDMVKDVEKAECKSCATGFVLQDSSPLGPCKDVSSLECDASDKIDPAPTCNSCADGYQANAEGMCRVNCYTCGSFPAIPANSVTADMCQIPTANSTGGTGFATMQECADGNVCVSYRFDSGNVIAGCAPAAEVNDNIAYTCDADRQNEFCLSADAAVPRCEKCCMGNLCNTYVGELDGKAFGVPSATVNVLLVFAASLVAFFKA